MERRYAVWRALPGPVGVAGWLAVTVAAPQLSYRTTHRWEEDQNVSTALWWTVLALPVLGALVAARWTSRTEHRHRANALLAAVTVATVTGAFFLTISLAVYRWVIPLGGTLTAWPVVVSGLSLAAAGASIGHLIGSRATPERRTTRRSRYLGGAVVAVLGALLLPVILRWGADDSTRTEGSESLPVADLPAGAALTVELSAAGRYGIYAKLGAPKAPDCRFTRPGRGDRAAELVSVPPGDYGGDAATYTWVAYFDVAAPGTYSVTCRTPDGRGTYRVGPAPSIAGAVGTLIHWPIGVIWLLGALPGLLAIAAATRRPDQRVTA